MSSATSQNMELVTPLTYVSTFTPPPASTVLVSVNSYVRHALFVTCRLTERRGSLHSYCESFIACVCVYTLFEPLIYSS